MSGASPPAIAKPPRGSAELAADPQWRAVAGAPSACVAIASRPEVLPPFEVAPCADEPRCRELVLGAAEVLASHPEGPRVVVRRVVDGYAETLVVDEAGAIVAALRGKLGDPSCLVGRVGLAPSRLLHAATYLAGDEVGSPVVVEVGLDTPSEARVIFDGAGHGVAEIFDAIVASDAVVGLEVADGAIWRLDGEGPRLVGGPSRGEGRARIDAVVGRALYYSTGSSRGPMTLRVDAGEGPRDVLPPQRFDQANLRLDGEQLVWQRLVGRLHDHRWRATTLETASSSELDRPRTLLRLDGPAVSNPRLLLGGGWLLLADPASGAVDLRDARSGDRLRRLEPDDERQVFLEASYAAPGEIGLAWRARRGSRRGAAFRWYGR
ncbi:MAG: hypothetical protein KC731_15460 [Myxococcales bacterium]|nr:hypothetical protein [Myxococcales bacterium]